MAKMRLNSVIYNANEVGYSISLNSDSKGLEVTLSGPNDASTFSKILGTIMKSKKYCIILIIEICVTL